MNLVELFGARWILSYAVEEKFSVDLDYGEEIVQLVRNKAGRFVCSLELAGDCRVDVELLFLFACTARAFFQDRCSSFAGG